MGQVEVAVKFTQKEVKDILTDKAKELSGQKGLNTSSVSFNQQTAEKENDQFATVSFKVNGKASS